MKRRTDRYWYVVVGDAHDSAPCFPKDSHEYVLMITVHHQATLVRSFRAASWRTPETEQLEHQAGVLTDLTYLVLAEVDAKKVSVN